MEAWTAETIKAYYREPEVVWFDAGYGKNGGVLGGPITEPGYYVLAHCGRPECCRPSGPFETTDQAQDWSRKNLAL